MRGDELQAAERPVLARVGGVAIDFAHRHAADIVEEADVPVDIFHPQRHVFY
jgi:hypothetical protein